MHTIEFDVYFTFVKDRSN